MYQTVTPPWPGTGCAVLSKPLCSAASSRPRSPWSIEPLLVLAPTAPRSTSPDTRCGRPCRRCAACAGSRGTPCRGPRTSFAPVCGALVAITFTPGVDRVQRVPARGEECFVRGGRALLRLPERRRVRLGPDRDVANRRIAPQDVRDERAVRRARGASSGGCCAGPVTAMTIRVRCDALATRWSSVRCVPTGNDSPGLQSSVTRTASSPRLS